MRGALGVDRTPSVAKLKWTTARSISVLAMADIESGSMIDSRRDFHVDWLWPVQAPASAARLFVLREAGCLGPRRISQSPVQVRRAGPLNQGAGREALCA